MPSLLPDKATRVTASVTREWSIVEFGVRGDHDYRRLTGKALGATIISYLASRFGMQASYRSLGAGTMNWVIDGQSLSFEVRQFATSRELIDFVVYVQGALRAILSAQRAARESRPITLPEVPREQE
jgi:hypothetical protein